MAKVRVVLNRRGVRELLKSDAVAGACKAQADAIRDRCGDGYESDVYTGKNRVNGICIEKLRLLPGIDGPSDNLPFHRLLTVRPPGNLRRQRFLCVIHR